MIDSVSCFFFQPGAVFFSLQGDSFLLTPNLLPSPRIVSEPTPVLGTVILLSFYVFLLYRSILLPHAVTPVVPTLTNRSHSFPSASFRTRQSTTLKYKRIAHHPSPFPLFLRLFHTNSIPQPNPIRKSNMAKFRPSNILGDPFALMTISISIVRSTYSSMTRHRLTYNSSWHGSLLSSHLSSPTCKPNIPTTHGGPSHTCFVSLWASSRPLALTRATFMASQYDGSSMQNITRL